MKNSTFPVTKTKVVSSKKDLDTSVRNLPRNWKLMSLAWRILNARVNSAALIGPSYPISQKYAGATIKSMKVALTAKAANSHWLPVQLQPASGCHLCGQQ